MSQIFTIQFPLKTQKFQEDILTKRFEIARKIYNALVSKTQKRYKEMIKTKKYRGLVESLNHDKKHDKPIYQEIENMRREYNLSEWSIYNDVKDMCKHFKENIDTGVAKQLIASLWKGYEKLFYGNGDKIHYKKYDTLNSVCGVSNKFGIRVQNDCLTWKGLNIPIKIDYNNPYEAQAMKNEIRYSRIVRKYVKNRYRYYVQIVFKGELPIKIDKNTGEIKHQLGKGDVGLNLRLSKIAISSNSVVKDIELADRVQPLEDERRRLLRKMDRSRRATNPDNYNTDGTIKKQGSKKVIWIKSNHYIKNQNQLKEIFRKQAAIRKYQHECLANYILSLGNNFFIQKPPVAKSAKKAKATEKTKAGSFKSKKRFGKIVANKAPAMLVEIFKRKLNYFDKNLYEAQLDNTEEKATSKYIIIDNKKIEKVLYEAFLLMNTAENLKEVDTKKQKDSFQKFLVLQK